ncbi:MAG TPA: chemotaxis protein CheB, partial [Patescibacteria group bacterium]|nr:chemotaxis protein CheB [Patescibacteria group bacterium]
MKARRKQAGPRVVETVEHGSSTFPIVGIGASAGGLEAFAELLKALPIDTGMAFVLVQHLSPDHESTLSDILSKSTKLPVLEATHGMAIRPNHVYIIPPNKSMTVSRGILQILPRSAFGPHLPIDHFMRSLANDRQQYAIGVILSGSGTDGTQGLDEIKAAGGITFAQTEA